MAPLSCKQPGAIVTPVLACAPLSRPTEILLTYVFSQSGPPGHLFLSLISRVAALSSFDRLLLTLRETCGRLQRTASCGSNFSPGRGTNAGQVAAGHIFFSRLAAAALFNDKRTLFPLFNGSRSDEFDTSMEGGSRQKQGRRQRRREARFTVTGNPVHGWRRWTSLYTGMPQRPLLLTMVSTGGLHPRSVTGEGCTVLGDDTLCFQPIASRGGKAVEALLRERCTKEATVGEGLLRVRYLNPPLVVRTNGTQDRHWSQCWQLMAGSIACVLIKNRSLRMFRAGTFHLTTLPPPSTMLVMVRAPFGAWVHGRITSQRQGLKDRYGEILDRTMFVMVQLLSSDDIWVDTYVPYAAR